tara:strand:- start:120 stop:380 length:261 start_codon:yes stop_codon:yes gene_type:complete
LVGLVTTIIKLVPVRPKFLTCHFFPEPSRLAQAKIGHVLPLFLSNTISNRGKELALYLFRLREAEEGNCAKYDEKEINLHGIFEQL